MREASTPVTSVTVPIGAIMTSFTLENYLVVAKDFLLGSRKAWLISGLNREIPYEPTGRRPSISRLG